MKKEIKTLLEVDDLLMRFINATEALKKIVNDTRLKVDEIISDLEKKK